MFDDTADLPKPPTRDELAGLEHRIAEARAAGEIDQSVELALEYGVGIARYEYNKLAARNAGLIIQFSRRSLRVLTVIVLVLAASAAANVVLLKREGQRTAQIRRIVRNESVRSTEVRHLLTAEASSRSDAVRLACEQSNEHHRIAKRGIETLARQTTPSGQRSQRLIDEFVQAVAPAYLAGKGTLAQREQQGCTRRVEQLTRP